MGAVEERQEKRVEAPTPAPPRVIYRHYRLGAGRVTLAGMLYADGEASFNVAFCSPKDQFTRARGRAIAGGRWQRRGGVIRFNDNAGWSRQLYAEMLCYCASLSGSLNGLRGVPRWAAKAAAVELAKLP